MNHSIVISAGKVPRFPSWQGEKVYMEEFTQAEGLPKHLERWQPTVDAMLDGIVAPGPIYLMVDQAYVHEGECHRRPGLHVDGYWCSGHTGHGRTPPPEEKRPRTSEEMMRRHLGWPNKPKEKKNKLSAQQHRHVSGTGDELLILASDVFGCQGYAGPYEPVPWNKGDCSGVSREGLVAVDFEPHRVYMGQTISMLHESVPVMREGYRTVVRLNVPGVQ